MWPGFFPGIKNRIYQKIINFITVLSRPGFGGVRFKVLKTFNKLTFLWPGMAWTGLVWPGVRKWPGWPGKFFILHRIFKKNIFPGVFFDEKRVCLFQNYGKFFLIFNLKKIKNQIFLN